MAKGNILDNYDQYAIFTASCIASAAGSVYSRLETGLTNLQTIGWAVSRIVFWVPSSIFSQITALANFLTLMITSQPDLTSPNLHGPYVYDLLRFGAKKVAVAGALEPVWEEEIYCHDFAPGHEVLVIPQNIYFGLNWSFAGAPPVTGFSSRIYYREIELGKEDWYDLLQLRMPVGV